GQGRKIPLDVSPILTSVLEGMKLKRGAEEFVFGGAAGMRRDTAERERKRLIGNFAAPKFTWHDLRRTCGTFLACAPGIYSGAGAFHAAKRLGHSVVVSERHYAGAINNIPKGAETLEAAMGIQSLLSDTLPKGRQLSARKT
ncbi:MAG: hypothetical protein OEY28_12325, partial [Nitrospira sp.]|nr:hypothetical protein [Nitrospira sp.]